MRNRLFQAFLLLILIFSSVNLAISNTEFDNDESLLNTLICPTVQPQYINDINQCSAFITIPNPVSGDPSCVIASIFNDYNFSANASDDYPVGTTTVEFTASFTNGAIASCSIVIVVIDGQPPVFVCPAAPSIDCTINNYPPFANLDEFLMAGGIAQDNCGILDTLSFSHSGDVILNPGSCPLMIEREYRIFDINAQLATCIQMISVEDNTNPTITCPGDIVVQTSAPTCDRSVTVPLPTVDDNCGSFTVTNDFNGTGDATDVYPVGITTVTFTVMDDCGNTASCSFTIEVIETEPPVAICAIITVSVDSMGVRVLNPAEIDGGSFDNCDMDLDITLSPSSVDCTNFGPVLITMTVEDDSGNISDCVTQITVVDSIFPEITCPPNFIEECGSTTGPYQSLQEFLDDGGIATDNCGIDAFELLTEVSDQQLCPESIARIYQVTDTYGNTSTCMQVVTVEDTTIPTFDLPPDVTIECSESNLPSNTGSPTNLDDNCTGTLRITFSDNNVSGSCPNTYTILRTFNVTDECDNTASQVQTIEVEDTTNPIIVTPASNQTLECDGAGNINDLDTWINSNGGAVATDNCGVVNWNNDFTGLLDLCGATGSGTVTFTADDGCGNSASTIATFIIEDTTDPVLIGVPDMIDNIECSDDFPQFTVTATDGCGGATVATDTIYDESLLCLQSIGYLVTYSWTATDECDNTSDPIEKSFVVLRDIIPPVFVTCEGLIEIPNDLDECSFTGTINPPEVTDNCTVVTITNNISGGDPLNGTFDVGVPNYVVWTATDECGNVNSCSQTIIVIDNQDPVCSASNTTISLDGMGQGELGIANFDIELVGQDNCPGDLDAYIQRMTDNCNDPDNTIPGKTISVCCADIGTDVMVRVIVYDRALNTSECMVTVEVNDELRPNILESLPNVTVTCEFEYNDLSAFGTYVTDPMDREDYDIPGNNPYMDGLVSDNCGVETIESTALYDLDCGEGAITRTFTITDTSGNVTMIDQIITIYEDDPFDEYDITWPLDFTISVGCVTSSPPSSLTGEPTWTSKNCSNVGVFKNDVIFDNPTSGCPLIIRTWRLIDWCQYETNSGNDDGVFTYDQNIYVTNSNPPSITNCIDSLEVCMHRTRCKGVIDYFIDANDDCTDFEDLLYSYTIDEGNDGSIEIEGVGTSIPDSLERGEYMLVWTVDDRCGNRSSCSTLVNVRDCESPLAVCLNGISINLNEMPEMGIVAVVWAKEYNASSSDNCTPTDSLIYSFSPDVDSTSRIFTCDDLGRQDVELWVTDMDGNQSHCDTYMIVQDNKELCPTGPSRVSINGNVHSYTHEELGNVEVELEFNESNMMHLSDLEGDYAFTDLDMFNNYKLKASMDDNYLNGVSTLDLVMIQRHILGLEKLDSPHKIIAADANNSLNVDAIDLIEIRKLILGIYKEFTKVPSWRFVDGNQVYPDPEQPWNFETAMQMYNLDHSADNMDFVGIKSGDVNGSAMLKFGGRAVENRTQDHTLVVDYTNNITNLISDNQIQTYGFQMTIFGVTKDMKLTSDLIDITEDNYSYSEGSITVSWNSPLPIKLNRGDVIFTILNSNSFIEINSLKLEAEIYHDDYSVSKIRTKTKSITTVLPDFKVNAISPNPFTDYARIDFTIPAESHVTIQLFDVDGKTLYANQHMMLAGENAVTINSDQINDYRGLLYCVIKYKNETVTRSIVRL